MILEGARPIVRFDADLFFMMVEKLRVHSEKRIVVSLVDGTEIEVEIE